MISYLYFSAPPFDEASATGKPLDDASVHKVQEMEESWLGWVGGDYGYWTDQRSMPALRIVHWPSFLHLRTTAATLEEVIPAKYSHHCKNRVLQERPLQ